LKHFRNNILAGPQPTALLSPVDLFLIRTTYFALLVRDIGKMSYLDGSVEFRT